MMGYATNEHKLKDRFSGRDDPELLKMQLASMEKEYNKEGEIAKAFREKMEKATQENEELKTEIRKLKKKNNKLQKRLDKLLDFVLMKDENK